MIWNTEEILIIVKVYPTPSKKYGETVCIAGITRDGRWLRLYPIAYRTLPQEKKFEKWQWIRARITKAREKLNRPESYKIDADSIELLERIPAGKGWGERERFFNPYVSKSLEELLEKQEKSDISLGAFRPKKVLDFIIEPSTEDWSTSQQGILNQMGLFSNQHKQLEKIPYRFRYHFTCNDERCTANHNMVILDWEIFESYRKWKRIYKEEKTTLEKLRYKWLTYFFEERETYFIVGTESEFGKFMILTVVSPKRITPQLILGL